MATDINKKNVLDFLRKISILSCSINGHPEPISAILLYVIDDDFTIYFATNPHSRKAKFLARDNRLSYSVWEVGAMFVQGGGKAELLPQNKYLTIVDRLSEAAANLDKFWPPVLFLGGEEYCVYKIKTKWLRVMDLNKMTIHSQNNGFINLLPDEKNTDR